MFARLVIVAVAALAAWGAFVRPSDGAGPERAYVVRPGDTLWAIAVQTYAGDPREGVWRLQERNGLDSPLIRPGQRLVLPARSR
jgi:nucleoid-associated protein YgaU